jgi:hypothetical protein
MPTIKQPINKEPILRVNIPTMDMIAPIICKPHPSINPPLRPKRLNVGADTALVKAVPVRNKLTVATAATSEELIEMDDSGPANVSNVFWQKWEERRTISSTTLYTTRKNSGFYRT